ncbi:hypothetical protein EG68_05807, partial [Paragonimus skrjabini miyazakii]
KTTAVSYSCLTSNVTAPCRSVPRKFTYDLPEFKLSAMSCIDRDDPRLWPFRGPVLLQAGYYSIPCTVSIPATQHPTVTLRQNVSSANWFSLDHSYAFHTTLEFRLDESSEHTSVKTKSLPLKIASCGPLPKQLPTGDSIPAVNEAFVLNDVELLIQADSLVVQDGDSFHFYLFTNKPGSIKTVKALLLQIFHVPSMKLDDEKSLYAATKYPPNVVLRAQSATVHLQEGFQSPFTEMAETTAKRTIILYSSRQSGVNITDGTVPNNQHSQARQLVNLSRHQRLAGCMLTIEVPVQTIPQINVDDIRISYYVRIIITFGRKITTCSFPVSIVNTQIEDYVQDYLPTAPSLEDRALLKLNRYKPCVVS